MNITIGIASLDPLTPTVAAGTEGSKFDASTNNKASPSCTRCDTIIAGAGNDRIEGDIGADSIVGSDGVDTIEYNATNEFGDTITKFTLGATGDVRDLDVAAAGADTLQIITAATDVDTGAKGMIVADFDVSTAGASMTGAQIYTAINGTAGKTNMADNEVTYFVFKADADNSDSAAYVYYTQGDASNSTYKAVALVATISLW